MHYLLKTIEAEGYKVSPSDKILDFGCGNGSLVQLFRENGYDAYGCDLRFKEGPYVAALEKQKIYAENYRLPFDDNTFDFIVSETVFEHVQNTDETIAEIYRVLKPGGVTLHFFPAKYGVVESHVHLPFASIFKSYPYLLFWALLGFRKKKQKGLSASEAARQNKEYLDSSTNYLSTREIKEAFGTCFQEVRFVEKTAIRLSPACITVILSKGLFFVPFLPFLYRTFKSVAVFTRK